MTPERAFLKREERLRKKADFDRVFRQGDVIQDPFFVVIYIKNSLPFSRIGISVKKKFGKAHDRNRLRRLVKEVFRRNKAVFPKGYDILFIARKDLSDSFKCNKVDYHMLCERLLRIARRIDEKQGKNENCKNNGTEIN
ncbi:ribonuclease P [Kosmotoga arenicorallina S304]|uniref:Ribonuclease P protein component n=1 Tax=Kosmotoga arenicorallina S304 TaxID=1453497 RepID=A0A176K0S6_9BACT|nr:ribonuclease P protein component [Kosmotoga arenicorallina]OAA30070.1 ribonuclease P [Kosmotoga arenicorallina S304]